MGEPEMPERLWLDHGDPGETTWWSECSLAFAAPGFGFPYRLSGGRLPVRPTKVFRGFAGGDVDFALIERGPVLAVRVFALVIERLHSVGPMERFLTIPLDQDGLGRPATAPAFNLRRKTHV